MLAFAAIAPQANATFAGGNGYIYFEAYAKGGDNPDVWRVRPDGKGLVNLTGKPGGASEGLAPSAASNGRGVAFMTGFANFTDIWAMSSAGNLQDRLTFGIGSNADRDLWPTISADGQRIVFTSSRETTEGLDYELWIMDSDGTDAAPLTGTPNADRDPTYSPNGNNIFFAYETAGGDHDIVMVGSEPPNGGVYGAYLTYVDGPGDDRNPTVHPSGDRIAYERGGNIYSRDLMGGEEQPLAVDGTFSETGPVYSPDGKKLLFATTSPFGPLMLTNANGQGGGTFAIDGDRVDLTTVKSPSWEADTRPPVVKITKKPKKRGSKTTARFAFRASEAGSTYRCKLDRTPFKPCKPPRTYKRLKPGRHVFQVRATDFAGNAGKPAKYAFKVTR